MLCFCTFFVFSKILEIGSFAFDSVSQQQELPILGTVRIFNGPRIILCFTLAQLYAMALNEAHITSAFVTE